MHENSCWAEAQPGAQFEHGTEIRTRKPAVHLFNAPWKSLEGPDAMAQAYWARALEASAVFCVILQELRLA